MPEIQRQKRRTAAQDGSLDFIHQGWSLAQLGKLFGREPQDIRDAILRAQLEPHALRGGHPVYLVSDIAHFIIAPHKMIKAEDQEKILRNMNPKYMSKELHREFWSGQRAKQIYEENEGDLWRTEDVFEHISEAFKILRTTLLVARDTVESETELSADQRKVVSRIFDSALVNLKTALIDKFEEKTAKRESSSEEAEVFDL